MLFVMKGLLGIILTFCLFATVQSGICGETQDNGHLHGSAWAFGQSGEREAAIWKNGVSASTIQKKTIKKDSQVTDTTGGINRAIEKAEKPKGHVGLTVRDQTGAWKVNPAEKGSQVDESMFRDRTHVVRAFADVKPADDLSISVGPELILKDENRSDETANESQPDKSLGFGMRFKYDF